MTETLIDVLRAVHIITAVLMAWPFYALVAVNQRARLGPPLGDRADTYLENTIRNRTIPCAVFQGTALLSGLTLVWLRGLGLEGLAANPVLVLKVLLLFATGALLSYVTFGIQPRIDGLFGRLAAEPGDATIGKEIGRLRLRRKRIAATCLFFVLMIVVLGIQVWATFPLWLNGLLIGALAAFSWRSYASRMPFGWF